MKSFFCLLIAGIFSIVCSGQSKKSNSYTFHSINNITLLNGDNGTSAAIQTVNGFSRQKIFAGIGVGIDYYQYRSVPVFADVRYEFGKKRNRFFLYADGGINCSWVGNASNDWNWDTKRDFSNGLYTDKGGGLNAYFKNGNAFIVSLGYSHKAINETVLRDVWISGNRQETLTETNNYKFNRIVAKLGFRF